MKQQRQEQPVVASIPSPSVIGKRTGNAARGNLLESLLRTKKNESDEEQEGFDLMKIARQAIN